MGELPISHFWTPYGAPTTSERSNEQAYLNYHSYKTVTNGSNQGIVTNGSYIPITSGSTYEVSWWYYPVTDSNPGAERWTQATLAPGVALFGNGLHYQGLIVPNYDQWNYVKLHFKATLLRKSPGCICM